MSAGWVSAADADFVSVQQAPLQYANDWFNCRHSDLICMMLIGCMEATLELQGRADGFNAMSYGSVRFWQAKLPL